MIEVLEVSHAGRDGRNRDGGESCDFGRLLLLDAQLVEGSRRVLSVVGLVETVSTCLSLIDFERDGTEVRGSRLLRFERVDVPLRRRLSSNQIRGDVSFRGK